MEKRTNAEIHVDMIASQLEDLLNKIAFKRETINPNSIRWQDLKRRVEQIEELIND